MAAKSEKMKAPDIVQAIRDRFADRQRYAVLTELARSTGFAYRATWIDVAVLNLWPSDGLLRCAYEVKVSRSDFIREIENPKKNEWARECFHEFSFVTAPGVVKSEDEIPEGAGWYVVGKGGMRRKKIAQRRSSPKLDDNLLAAIARSISKDAEVIAKEIAAEDKAKDRDYAAGVACRQAVCEFLASRGIYMNGSTLESVRADLEKATLDKRVEKMLHGQSRRLDNFRRSETCAGFHAAMRRG